MPFRIRPKEERDGEWLAHRSMERYGSDRIVAHGVGFEPLELPGFVADNGAELFGALTYSFMDNALEIVTLDSFSENGGVGTSLLESAVDEARRLGACKAWLITSNDNIRALRFYQRRGWNMVALHRDAIDAARRIKPQIPLHGEEGIPIRHEIEFEFVLQD